MTTGNGSDGPTTIIHSSLFTDALTAGVTRSRRPTSPNCAPASMSSERTSAFPRSDGPVRRRRQGCRSRRSTLELRDGSTTGVAKVACLGGLQRRVLPRRKHVYPGPSGIQELRDAVLAL